MSHHFVLFPAMPIPRHRIWVNGRAEGETEIEDCRLRFPTAKRTARSTGDGGAAAALTVADTDIDTVLRRPRHARLSLVLG